MGYVEDNLLKGEEIKYTAHVHWAAFLPSLFWTILAIIATFSLGSDVRIVAVILWIIAAFRYVKGLFYKLFTEFILTNTRIIYKYGFISRQTLELQLNKCEGVSVDQGILGRMLNFGSVYVTTGGPTSRFSVVADPVTFRNYINEQIDIVHSTEKEAKNSPLNVADTKPVQQPKSTMEEIKELSELMKQGLITEEEFRAMKDKIINR